MERKKELRQSGLLPPGSVGEHMMMPFAEACSTCEERHIKQLPHVLQAATRAMQRQRARQRKARQERARKLQEEAKREHKHKKDRKHKKKGKKSAKKERKHRREVTMDTAPLLTEDEEDGSVGLIQVCFTQFNVSCLVILFSLIKPQKQRRGYITGGSGIPLHSECEAC